jgi:hypothetical protein
MHPLKTALALAALLCCPALFADDPPPVEMGALVRGFALPALGRPDVLAAHALQQRVYLNDTNEFAALTDNNESIILDGEVTQLSYELRYGINDRWEAGVFVPLLLQGGGILDGVIQGWHNFWHLPNGNRQYAPSNRYLYEYQRNGQVLLDVSQGSLSFGDIRLSTGYRLADHLAARAMLQLPSGDASHLSGNGAVGGALWLDGGLPLSGYFINRLTLYGSLGFSYTGNGQVLQEQQKNALPFGGVGLGLRLTSHWDARLQVYVHDTPYRDSDLGALARIGAPLTVSTSYRVAPKTTVSLGFQEKASIYASPDFGVFLGVTLD